MSSKRKHTARTIADKLRILCEIDKNEKSKTEIAREFGIPLSTLSTYVKNRQDIEKHAENSKNISTTKRLRGAKYPEVEQQLFEWFCEARAANIPITGNILKEKADNIALRNGIEFSCSNGWLQRFQMRHSIACVSIKGEGASADTEAAEEWRCKITPILDQYSAENTYNMDETGLFYQMRPDKTLALKGETCRGGKKAKARLTVLLCTNADGSDKLKPLVVGRFEHPRCFKNVRSLPCNYKANKSAWVTSTIFSEWLISLERQMACRNRKILLLMDNCSAHAVHGLELKNVRVLFLPPNTTSYLQPLDQGIIYSFKSFYKKRLVRYLLREMERGVDEMEIRPWNVLDALRNITASWNEVTSLTIKNCFVKSGFCPELGIAQEAAEANEPSEDWDNLASHFPVLSSVTFKECVQADDSLYSTTPTDEHPTISGCDEGGDEGESDQVISSEITDDHDNEPEASKPTRHEVFCALSVLERMVASSAGDESLMNAFDTISEFAHSNYSFEKKQKKNPGLLFKNVEHFRNLENSIKAVMKQTKSSNSL